jgi:hypothetical protein
MNTITQTKREELAAKIEPLRQQIESWRTTRARNEPMPEPLWAVATGLAKEYGVSPVQRILRIDYRGLEYRPWACARLVRRGDRPERRSWSCRRHPRHGGPSIAWNWRTGRADG